jgi:hypothetical protein
MICLEQRLRIDVRMIVRQQIETIAEIFSRSLSSVGASAAAGMSSQCPLQTEASSSRLAEIVKMTGRDITSRYR